MADDQMTLASGFSYADSFSSHQQLAYKSRMTVYVRKMDIGEPQKLFTDEINSLSCPLAWSPDGRTIYHSYDQIYAIDVATGKSRPVTAFPKTDGVSVIWLLTVSPDGSRLLFLESRNLSPQTIGAGKFLSDGNIAAPRHIAGIRVDGTHYERIIEGTSVRDIWMALCNWSQNLLAFSIITDPEELWVSDTDGQNGRIVRLLPLVASMDLSPDAKQIVFTGDQGLGTLAIANGKTEHLCDFGACGSWSPDGQNIAFMKGDTELWLLHTPDKTSKVLVKFSEPNPPVSSQSGSYAVRPIWSPDGRFLWFTLSKAKPVPEKEKQEFAKQLDDSIGDYPMSQEARAGSLRMNQWHFDHKVGVIDFAEQKVWLEEGYWSDVAWGPLTHH